MASRVDADPERAASSSSLAAKAPAASCDQFTGSSTPSMEAFSSAGTVIVVRTNLPSALRPFLFICASASLSRPDTYCSMYHRGPRPVRPALCVSLGGPMPTAERPNPTVADVVAGVPLRGYQSEAVVRLSGFAADASRVHVAQMPTGSGKTRVGCALAAWLIAQGRTLLWISKSWGILQQAADSFADLFPQHAAHLSRVGGDDSVLQHLPEARSGRIVFTTLQTWTARGRSAPPN